MDTTFQEGSSRVRFVIFSAVVTALILLASASAPSVQDDGVAYVGGPKEPGDPIVILMSVADAPSGSVVRVAVYDAAEREVWVEEGAVVGGEPHLLFTIDTGALAAGSYEARVIVGDERIARRSFEIAGGV